MLVLYKVRCYRTVMIGEPKGLEEFKGTYRGFTVSPDESHVGLGEAEVIIDDQQVLLRGASGVGINWESRDLGRAKKLSKAETIRLFPDGLELSDVRAFSVGSLFLIFNLEAKEDEPMLIPTESRAVLGALYGPKQLETGRFETVYKSIEETFDTPGGFPLLELGGYAPIDVDANEKSVS